VPFPLLLLLTRSAHPDALHLSLPHRKFLSAAPIPFSRRVLTRAPINTLFMFFPLKALYSATLFHSNNQETRKLLYTARGRSMCAYMVKRQPDFVPNDPQRIKNVPREKYYTNFVY
jgi:hypothetical protein